MASRLPIAALSLALAFAAAIAFSEEPVKKRTSDLESTLTAVRLVPKAELSKERIAIPSAEMKVPRGCVEWLMGEEIVAGGLSIGYRRDEGRTAWFWHIHWFAINGKSKETHARVLQKLRDLGFRSIDADGKLPHAFRRDTAPPNDRDVEEIVRISDPVTTEFPTRLDFEFEWVVRSKKLAEGPRPTFDAVREANPLMEPQIPVAHPIPPALLDLFRKEGVDRVELHGVHEYWYSTQVELPKRPDGSLPVKLEQIAAVSQAGGLQEEEVGRNKELGGKLQFGTSSRQGERAASCRIYVFDKPTVMRINMQLQP